MSPGAYVLLSIPAVIALCVVTGPALWRWCRYQIDERQASKTARQAYSPHMRARASLALRPGDGIAPPRQTAPTLASPRTRRRKVLSMPKPGGRR